MRLGVWQNNMINRNRGDNLEKSKWLLCPTCKNKTRIKIRDDTELKNFPLYCPKCRQEKLINVRQFNMSVTKEPEAETSL